MKFQLGMMFTNKEVIRDVVKDYGMEIQKNVFIKWFRTGHQFLHEIWQKDWSLVLASNEFN